MAKPRNPSVKAETEGRTVINPGRYAGRAKPKARPLGKPYIRMTDEEKEIWAEFAEEMPWLSASDRKILAVACRLTARFWADPEMGVNALGQLRMCLSSMGGTPSDVSKIYSPDEEEDDPAAEYVN